MKAMQREVDALPEEFATEEEAAEFWEQHDTTDYLEFTEEVPVDARLERRRYLIEVDADLIQALNSQAHARGVGLHAFVTEALRAKTRSAA